jgi:hypothetical protein
LQASVKVWIARTKLAKVRILLGIGPERPIVILAQN